ncbi:GNAT family N-acetyltransferase [Jiella avicenniae]|uniref:GNAT family N-acetyltransferase n=1 Tax=Jiella avicenniae TaxID=2907202 RepID=A0A9X1T6T0_9HYPH|nr:GNAT family N-acetyltransferase [Jiella avicenniae]MCE7029695.1 GNAT family N-acetyltransferase [Jiella avicenniae]
MPGRDVAAGYDFAEEIPAINDYRRLRAVAGLTPKSFEAARIALPNTLFAVVVRHQGRVIGMGRVVGDGGCHMQIVAMAVEPAHQGKGIGKGIFAAFESWLARTAPDTAYVSLIADGDAKHLYAKFGFEPVMPASIGMARFYRGDPAKR